MKKLIATILTVTFLIAIVATPKYKVNSPSFSMGASVLNDRQSSGSITTK